MLSFFKKWGMLPLIALVLITTTAACGWVAQSDQGGVQASENGNQVGSESQQSGGEGQDSADASSPATAAENSPGTTTFPITIQHAKGETVLKQKPKKVVVTYFPYADHLFAIGEQDVVSGVVGLKSLQNFPVYDAFTKQGNIADLGDSANLEKILELDPDVIIAWEEDEKIYDQLSKIADTIMIPQSENWQDTITKVAAVIGEQEKADLYIADYNKKLDALAAQMTQTGVQGKTAIFMMTWGKGFNYYGGVRMEPYYERLGFAKFPGMKDWGEISLEGVADIDPDYIFLGEDFTNSAEVRLEELDKNEVWNNLEAVKNGHLFVIDTEIVGPLAMGQAKDLEVIKQIMQ
ncbi:ABC transporter substrate-binding protein [Brevibacillus humidisoli]|uniref:ABC transporter substrate-binding protein n=1 Tax=Brevibacillus humidisoli TaxID=2895522 RepID=UPI001E6445A9|nr:ABC transporter substrate-binding protein [Brevibacillus humidisoli]UFJ40710.1 ABC transporter substrate-binding protein [Brevibacillus humidisoli]